MRTQSERLNLRVLRVHKEALRKLARLEGEPMSVVLRRLIRQSALSKGVWPDTVFPTEQTLSSNTKDDDQS
jgi:hypothetical protein